MLRVKGDLGDLLSEFAVPEESFTTPSLDFAGHSQILKDLVERLVKVRNQMQDKHKHLGEEALVKCCQYVLEQLNHLTKPQQRRQGRQCSRTDQQKSTQNLTEQDLDSISVHSFDPTLSNQQKAFYHWMRARVLNVFDNYHPGAELNLTRAVKFDPTLIDAWSELGHLYCKKRDLSMAKHCFEYSLLHKRDKRRLVDMAMILRQQVQQDTLQSSIKLSGLGMAYLKLFFNITRDTRDLLLSLAAYNRVAKTSSNPDLFQNRAVIHQYREEYQQAIDDFSRAAELDPLLAPECLTQIKRTREFIHLPVQEKMIEQYKTGLLDSRLVFKIPEAEKITLGLLKDRCIRCRQGIKSQFRSFVVMDKTGQPLGLTVYNLRGDAIKIHDTLVIAHPTIVALDDLQVIYSGSKFNSMVPNH
ncbi:hypothetical protein EDD86DRAFT_245809 [Gorgonomyces haynaldii]|nr:hypothetical protein EDD86DRAFT_245809 [Gorgonomyces haynaldii]